MLTTLNSDLLVKDKFYTQGEDIKFIKLKLIDIDGTTIDQTVPFFLDRNSQ